MNNNLIRFIDFIMAMSLFIILFPMLILIFLLCFLDTTKPIFMQTRIGKNSEEFSLYKFRSMKTGTPNLPTHLVSTNNITRFGKFLRSSKLDELPQLINVIIGNMSFVGPRPCLPSQKDLIEKRKTESLDKIRPGITGIAQINNIDMSDINLLIETEKKMQEKINLRGYFEIIFKTIFILLSKLIH